MQPKKGIILYHTQKILDSISEKYIKKISASPKTQKNYLSTHLKSNSKNLIIHSHTQVYHHF
jgi:hypothetical protein